MDGKKRPLEISKVPLSSVQNLSCSLAASCVAEAVTYPFEVAKVRLQLQGSRDLLPGEGIENCLT